MTHVAVVTSHPPFAEGGHLVLARALVDALREAGCVAEVVYTPQNRFGRQLSAYLATRLTDVERTHDDQPIDRVISTRFPAYAVRHPVHVCWLSHRMREYYDLWDRWYSTLSRRQRLKERGRRALIHRLDHYFLSHLRARFVLSRTIQERLRRWGDLDSEVLYPPPPQRRYRTDEYGPYIFAVSRLHPLKRMDLLVNAAAQMPTGLRVVIAGEGEEAARLSALVRDRHLEARVSLIGRITESQLLDHLARCRAVFFGPLREDYGFVTLEAFRSRKPVVTCTDSGGPAELVVHGESGFVVEATPQAVAAACEPLAEDAALAERLGEAGLAATQHIQWAAAVERLLTA